MGCECHKKKDKLVDYLERVFKMKFLNGKVFKNNFYIINENIKNIINKINIKDLLKLSKIDTNKWQLTFIYY